MTENLYALYERMLPQRLRLVLTPWVSSPLTLRWLILYAVIGATGVSIYLTLVFVLSRAHWPALPATAVSMVAGASVQFVLNRNLNFRAFHRTAARQAGSYAAVFSFNFVLTLAIVWFCTRTLYASALAANVVAVVLTVPIGYLANRHLTFGSGIRHAIMGMSGFLREKLAGARFRDLLFTQVEAILFWLAGGLPGIIGFTVRAAVCKLLFERLGGFCWIAHGVTIVHSNRLRAGKHFGCNTGAYLNAIGGIEIGDYVLLGSNVTISSGVHTIEGRMPPVFARPAVPAPIRIEDDVWIGAGAVIMPGVTLKRGSVIGANAVVTKDTEEYSVNVGVPAREIRKRDDRS